ncbi:MAG: hypothetical protein KME15_03710 [Drouetiella hepatica Uher 2000/2452]|uniref:Uncharacterized protein n=1 Tax=Drouetiella hepatica Uher 2000/2452 TaxID=904376 RepID=A0A951UL09_9CYAN|nr:hypothetical protein [Drouetiella hepatica Uher 2000/2452]
MTIFRNSNPQALCLGVLFMGWRDRPHCTKLSLAVWFLMSYNFLWFLYVFIDRIHDLPDNFASCAVQRGSLGNLHL